MTSETDLNDLLTIRQVVDLLHIHRATLRNWRREGLLRALRVGPHKRLVRFKRQDIEALLSEEEQDLDEN